VELSQLWPQERGRYRYRISAYAVQSNGKPVTFSVMNGDGGMGGAKSHLVGYFDAPPDKPEVFEFIDLVEPRTGGYILPYGTATAHVVSKIGAETYDGPGVAIEWTEGRGATERHVAAAEPSRNLRRPYRRLSLRCRIKAIAWRSPRRNLSRTPSESFAALRAAPSVTR
jgi:hypothetical protein